MAKNDFLRKRDERDREYYEAGMRTGAQLVVDFISMSLHDPDVMGKNRILSRNSIEKVLSNCKKLDEYFSLAFSKHVEADARREEWDKVLKEIYGDDTDPFEKRYPDAHKFSYMKPLKGWVD